MRTILGAAPASDEGLNTRTIRGCDDAVARPVGVTSLQVVVEPLLPAAWLAASLVTAAHGHYLSRSPVVHVLSDRLRLIHNAFHGALDYPAEVRNRSVGHEHGDPGSMHAVRFTHLTHHRLNLTKEDVEAARTDAGMARAVERSLLYAANAHHRVLAWRRRLGHRSGATVRERDLHYPVFRFSPWDALRYHVIAMVSPLPDCILRGMDRAPSLRSKPLHCQDAA